MSQYFEAVKDSSKVMYTIQGERGGVVPKELQGKYTKKQFADDAIRAYEERKNGKVQASSGKSSSRTSRKAGKEELSGS